MINKNQSTCIMRVALALLAIVTIAGSLLAPNSRSRAQGLVTDTKGATDYLIQFASNSTPVERAQVLADLGGTLVTWLPQIDVASVRFADVDTAQRALTTIARGRTGLTIESDGMVWADTATITDPDFNDPHRGYGQRLVQLESAWAVTWGDPGVVIAIVDTGLDMNHPEFAGRIVAGFDFVNQDADPADDNGHGTHVAGIAAMAIDGMGSAGMCPSCSIMPLKALDGDKHGSWSAVAQAILFATDHGAHVINLSLGSNRSSTTAAAAIAYARDHGVVVVAAAGNDASDALYYPAAFDGVMAVVATDEEDQRWGLSNYGAWVDVAAPGVRIYSTYTQDGAHSYALMTGTSMATPFVSGLAALVVSAHPALTGEEVIALILEQADDLGEPGRDDHYGYGRINAARTLGAESDGQDSAQDDGGIPLGSTHRVLLPVVVN